MIVFPLFIRITFNPQDGKYTSINIFLAEYLFQFNNTDNTEVLSRSTDSTLRGLRSALFFLPPSHLMSIGINLLFKKISLLASSEMTSIPSSILIQQADILTSFSKSQGSNP